jgi:uncharacterized membrane protein YgcG
MRIKTRLLLALAPLALFLTLCVPSLALAQTGTYVFDKNDVLTQSEFSELESQGAQYADTYKVGVYLLITENMGQPNKVSSDERTAFAISYYKDHSLGVGERKDGIIFVLAKDTRQYVTVKHFEDKGTDPFSDDSVDYLEDEVKGHLSDDEWYEGSKAYYDIIGEHLEYFAHYGKQWKEPHPIVTILKVAATLLIPLMIAYGIVGSEKEAMKTARMQTEASNYVKPDGFDLRVSTDTFLHSSLSVIPIPKHEDSDSDSGWSDSGGGFSSSGGGDF